jgi:hypothetical protein
MKVILETAQIVMISMNVRRRPTTVMITPNARIPLGPSDVHAMKVIAETGQNVKILMNARKTPTTVM